MTSTPPEGALDAGLDIARALESAEVPHALGGALAFGLWGIPRGTLDVDVNVFVDPVDLPSILTILEGLGIQFERDDAIRDAEREGMFMGWWGPIRIDVFVPSIDFSWEAARTRVSANISGEQVWFLSPEALAVFKLLFYRPKDLVDLERLLEVQGARLDTAYVRRWVADMLGDDDERVERWDALTASSTGGLAP